MARQSGEKFCAKNGTYLRTFVSHFSVILVPGGGY